MKKTTSVWTLLLTFCLLFSFAACRKDLPAEMSYSSAVFSETNTESISVSLHTETEPTEPIGTNPDTTRGCSTSTAADTTTAKTAAAPQTDRKEPFTAFSYAPAAHKPSVRTTAPHTTTTTQKVETTTADRRVPSTQPTTLPLTAAAPQIVTERSTAVQTVRVVVDCRHALSYQQENPDKTVHLPVNTNGIILEEVVPCTGTDTALSVLQKALSRKQLEADETRGYIRGIGGLYEKDCGGASGWMYSVNGEPPMTSAPKCTVSPGDTVRFYYVTNYGDTE